MDSENISSYLDRQLGAAVSCEQKHSQTLAAIYNCHSELQIILC